ncbi:MAG: Translation elongation factor G-related protein [Actinomycetia bacterium]|nr:Translation elongation factor G-related protein [Actinomycetes bacterium]
MDATTKVRDPETGVRVGPGGTSGRRNPVRNVALVGHGHSGKTTLAEALLFAAGVIARPGRVEDGTTVCDYDAEEQRRAISTGVAVAPFDLGGVHVNLLDVPGDADFVGDVTAALRAADLAIFVVSAVEGVEVGTEQAWRLAAARGMPRAIFVNKLDRERADFDRTLAQLQGRFGAGVAPLELPVGLEASFRGVIDLLSDVAVTYNGDGTTAGVEGPIPDDLEVREHAVHDALVEGIVVADDELTERYLADEPISTDELEHALAHGLASGTVFPVLCGSAAKLVGIDRLARFITEDGPAPDAEDGAPIALVFKTIADPYVGRVNVFKVLQGRVRVDDALVNNRTLGDERLHQLFRLRGREQEPVREVGPGDIGAVAKLHDTTTGDVLGARGAQFDVEPLELPSPNLATAIRPKSKQDDDKLATALHKLLSEDPTLVVERDPETHQTLLRGMGETHLSIALEKLQRRMGVEVSTEAVLVAYRETVTREARAEGRYKKQTGGHGQFGVAEVTIEPLGRGVGFEFVDRIVGGAVPRQFIPAVEKGVVEALEHGGPFGFPVVDVRVTLVDGKSHAVDSSEMSFRMAGSLAVRAALGDAEPTVLEPVSNLVVVAPETCQGDLLGDINAKRGRIQSTAALGDGEVEIAASIPTVEILRYAVDLRALTGGRGHFVAAHSHHDAVPPHLADKLRAPA